MGPLPAAGPAPAPAPAAAAAASPAARAAPAPAPLKDGQRAALWWCVPACVLMLVIGGIGLVVLLDVLEDGPISRTHLGAWYQRTIKVHQILVPIVFNGGLLGLVGCWVKLAEDAKARAAAKEAKAQ